MRIIFFTLLLIVKQIYSIKRLPQVNIDLSGQPEKRWSEAMQVISEIYTWQQSFGEVFANHNQTLFNCIPDKDYQLINQSIQYHFPTIYQEIQGLSNDFKKYFQQDVSVQYLSAWVYFHELSHTNICQQSQQSNLRHTDNFKNLQKKQFKNTECTGVLVKKPDGTVIHGRNMDQSPAEMRNIAVNMTLYQNNKIVGYATDIYWFTTGFVTAFVPGLISMQENWRDYSVPYEKVLNYIDLGYLSQVWPFRIVVEKQSQYNNFQKIIDFLSKNPSASPMYNVIGGVDDGAILTFEVNQSQMINKIYYLNTDAINGFFLIQTNYDQWLPDPEDDNRRTLGQKILEQMGQDLSSTEVGLFSIMDSYSLHNDDTIYTGIMNPSSGYYQFFGNDGINQVSPNS